MNREIKFRAWDHKKGKMITSYDDLDRDYMGGESMPLIPLTGGIVRPYWDKCKFDSQPHLELMQYTGLKDKNGVPIYEDDILDCYTSDVPCIVTWYGSEWGMWWIDESYTDFDNFDTSRHCEVVGNRYENPELLEQ